MQKWVRYIVNLLYKPLLVKYLSSTRIYVHNGIRLVIPSEVFHPGFFFSTRLLLKYVTRFPLKNKSLLELGAGSGLISLTTARKGAIVTASDINPVAIEYLEKNSAGNELPISIIHSDLFTRIPLQVFDIIVINPPYYNRKPSNYAEYAWFCGENGEYFSGLFAGLTGYTYRASEIWMILCDGSDLQKIEDLARQNGWQMECVFTKRNLLEKNFIFKIERASPGLKSAFAMRAPERRQRKEPYKYNPE